MDKLQRKIITTADGSTTIQIVDWNEQYHSTHGAIAEANHVFIKQGLKYYSESNDFKSNKNKTISVLEIGFGTGLNALLTLLKAEDLNLNINYTGVEAHPVSIEELKHLNYTQLLNLSSEEQFHLLHNVSWGNKHKVTKHFTFEKQQQFFEDIKHNNLFNIIYFDAFGARVQPHLWTEVIFKKMFNALKHNGVLVTYAANGSARRAMQSVGFTVEKLPGPPGKREMLRAVKV